jgi:hypothetical protein
MILFDRPKPTAGCSASGKRRRRRSIYLRTNSDLCHLEHKRIGFYNRDEKCLLRGTDCIFKKTGLRFVGKGLINVKP